MHDRLSEERLRAIRLQVMQSLRIIFRTANAHSALIEKKSGLNSYKLQMLWELSQQPGLRVSELAKRLSIHQATCSNALDNLEKLGLVRRERSSTDQRQVHLHLTGLGQEKLALAPGPARGILTTALEKLPESSLLDLAEGLTRLIDAIPVETERKKNALLPLDI